MSFSVTICAVFFKLNVSKIMCIYITRFSWIQNLLSLVIQRSPKEHFVYCVGQVYMLKGFLCALSIPALLY